MKPAAFPGRAGFSLVEGTVALVVTAIMMGALTSAMGSLFQSQAQPQVSFQSHAYSLAPSFQNFRQAVDLHAAFAQTVDQADNVIVIGGTRSHPTADPNGPSSALAETFSATSLTAAAGSDAFQGFSSWDQLELNGAQLAPYLTTHPDPADFTILTVQGQSHITSITQQRRYTAAINGQNVVLYEVTLQAIDWSSGSGVPTASPLTGSNPTYFYRTYYNASEDAWSQPPGATHYWYRTDPAWDRDQEGPTRVIFADPYVLAGQDPLAQIAAVSRFSYFLPQTR